MPLTRPVEENICSWSRSFPLSQRHQQLVQVRVWFNWEPGDPASLEDGFLMHEACNSLAIKEWNTNMLTVDTRLMARQLAGLLKRVNAVEVKIGDIGNLYYPEWP